MTAHRISTGLLYVSVLANGVLVAVTYAKLDVTPSDVQHLIRELHTEHLQRIENLEGELAEMQTELTQRGEWIETVDVELARRTKDRIYRRDVEQWVEGFRERNPEAEVPDLPSRD